MRERAERLVVVERNRERGQEPLLPTATRRGVPARRAPARQGQEREG